MSKETERPVLVKGLRAMQLLYKCYRYVRISGDDNTTYWRCESRSCPGRITTSGELETRNENGHNHEANPEEYESKRLRATMFEEARNNPSSPANEVRIVCLLKCSAYTVQLVIILTYICKLMRHYEGIQEIAARGKSNSSSKPKARECSASHFESQSSKSAAPSAERLGIRAQRPLHDYQRK